MKIHKLKLRNLSFIFLSISLFVAVNINAQVTIGSNYAPDGNALLDLKEGSDNSSKKGLLFPRVALLSTTQANPLSDHVEGMTVYNTANVGDVTAGHYYNDGSKWIKIATEESAAVPSFFYMPSMLLPTDISDPSYNSVTEIFTINLHSNYAAQFGLTNSVSVKDPSASVLPVLANNKLEYFITYYDNSVFQNVSVSDTGILTYKLASTYTITEKTFMNIVFKVK